MLCRLIHRSRAGGRESTNLLAGRRLCASCKRGYAGKGAVRYSAQTARPSWGRQGVRPAICAVGAGAAYGGYHLVSAWFNKQIESDIDLPPVPEPSGHFVHPYEIWPWYQKAWFAFKRSAAPLKASHVFLTSSGPAEVVTLNFAGRFWENA